jgi:hypothetical protein
MSAIPTADLFAATATPYTAAAYAHLLRELTGPRHAVQFDETDHTYAHPDTGRALFGTTSVLKATGLSTDWDAVPVAREVLEQKRALGQAAHAATHYHDMHQPFDGLDPRAAGYVESYLAWKAEQQPLVLATELRVRHRAKPSAGTIDKLVALPSDHRHRNTHDLIVRVVDIKLGDPEDAGAIYQLASYTDIVQSAAADGANPGGRVLVFPAVCLQLREDGSYPAVTWYDRPAERRDAFREAGRVFDAALTVLAARARRKGATR